MLPIKQTNEVLSFIRKRTNEAILFYSCGKDSIVLLDLMAHKFDKVYCVFMYLVKDLEHINRFINFSTSHYPNVEFMQVPHFRLATIYKHGIYCKPNNNIKKENKLSDIDQYVRIKTGCNWTFYGWKKADGLHRRLALNTYLMESISLNTQKVYPLSTWTKADVLSYVKQHKLPTPIAYGKKASNGVGLDLDCFLWMRKNSPGDLKKVIAAFPLSESILYEHDNKIPDRKRVDQQKKDQKRALQSANN